MFTLNHIPGGKYVFFVRLIWHTDFDIVVWDKQANGGLSGKGRECKRNVSFKKTVNRS